MVRRETGGVEFQLCEGPLESDALRPPLSGWEAERVRGGGGGGGERVRGF